MLTRSATLNVAMNHLYLFTLEIVPLEVGRVYDELPSHLTLMSRSWSELAPEELASAVRPLFTRTNPVTLIFGKTVELGPKKVMAHMVEGSDELTLHNELQDALGLAKVTPQYPQFIGVNHRPHVTKREGFDIKQGSQHLASAVYLIEVVDKKRVIRSRFVLGNA